jgi:predicted DNA-binding transcriptional regulator YafY
VEKPATAITIKVDKKHARYLYWDRHSFGFTSETVLEDSLLMHFNYHLHPAWFVRWFIQYVDVAEILEPEYLQRELVEILTSGLARAGQQAKKKEPEAPVS